MYSIYVIKEVINNMGCVKKYIKLTIEEIITS